MGTTRVILAAFICFVVGVDALYFSLPQGATRCLWEDLALHVPCTVTYKTRFIQTPGDVSKREPAAITISVRNPRGAQIVRQTGDQYTWNYAHFEATIDGPHEVCFTTERGGWFQNIDDTLLELVVETGESSNRYKLRNSGEVDVLLSRVYSLTARTQYVKDEQKQLKGRWEAHHDVQENTYIRVVISTVSKFLFIFGLCIWQSKHLKRFFKKKKIID
mmetsp:Transcript_15610/g.25866  ORF Transcript_15610/g.25866 Transcript_15610/m.25866 type:complete len:218 (+) Transcript_15610:49-702(+)